VIARVQRSAAHGEIVVALVDGESTIKRLHKKDGKLMLVPENVKMKPIPVSSSDLIIQGRVIGVQRFYR
jgi:SOS-response transcriptional repressor LexA